jgi:dolichyl-phosphate-mannose--protein O-mannosyl transferase
VTGRPTVVGLLPGLFAVAAVLVLAPRLSIPSTYMFDEVYHAYTAGQYAAGNADAYLWSTHAPREGVAYMWNHPPVGVLAITASILVWGDGPLGWRFACLVFGAAGIALAYVLGAGMLGDRAAAALGAALLLLDGLYFVQSRIGMLDIFGTVFAFLALASLHAYLTAPADRAAPRLVWTGLTLGLALATKWNAAYVSLSCGLVAVGRAIVLARAALTRPVDASARAALRSHVVWIPIGLGLLPAVVYLASYVPFFAAGHDFGAWIELQKQICQYHMRLEATHTYQSSWWQWPLALRPVWYWLGPSDAGVARIYGSHNPILVWMYLPAVLWLVARSFRGRPALACVLAIGFFGQWLPWALVPRIAFAYHFLPAVPWGALSLGALVAWTWRRGLAGRSVASIYVGLVVAAFVFFYPIWTGLPLTERAFEWRMWFPSWR